MKKSLILFLLLPSFLYAQDDLLAELEKDSEKETEYVFATFKGTRLGNGHTIETKNAGSLEFIFAHRFGAINGGWYEMYGLDDAYVRLGLDYGFTDWMSFSIGRNSFDKTMDSYLKFRALRQSTGARTFPFSLSVLLGGAYKFNPAAKSQCKLIVFFVRFHYRILVHHRWHQLKGKFRRKFPGNQCLCGIRQTIYIFEIVGYC